MLTVSDYQQLKLLYDKFFKSNELIKKLILEKDWDSVETAVSEKDVTLRQIIFFEKPRLKEIKANKELLEMRLKLIDLEKQNIELVKVMQQELVSEISNVKQAKKVLVAYEPSVQNSISTLDIKEDI